MVREIHISGGSWDDSMIEPKRKVRRDTHDDAVPDDVFKLLDLAINLCPSLKYVVLEQLGNGLDTETSKKLFYDDFLRMQEVVQYNNDLSSRDFINDFSPVTPVTLGNIVESDVLYQQQLQLSSILESAVDCEEVIVLLKRSSLANSDWEIEKWDPCMIETAMKIAQKWKHQGSE